MLKDKHLGHYIALIMIFVGTFSILSVHQRLGLWQHFTWENEPFHSTVEALGAFIAMAMAMIMLQRREEGGGRKFFPMALGFIAMGLLDGFHAVCRPGEQFVLLHSMAGLAGGFFFALVWLPKSDSFTYGNKRIPWIVATISILFGIWTFLSPETIPNMLHKGEFTTIAITINLLAGVLFLLATWRFILDFHRSGKAEDYLFVYLALLFSLAGFTFRYSELWDGGWWLWHLLRLVAYLLVLIVIVRGYQQTVFNLKVNIVERERSGKALRESKIKLQKAHNGLEIAITERTKELKTKLDELERFREATIDREFRIEQLRKEIERLKTQKKGPIA